MNEVEFLPERVRRHRARNRRLLRQGYLLAACVAAMGVLACVNTARIARAVDELDVLDKRAAGMNRRIAMIGPLQQELATLMIKKRIDEELGSRTDCTAMLAELCRVMPVNVALVSLELSTVEVPAGKVGRRGSSLHRSARAGVARTTRTGNRVVRRLRLLVTGLAPSDVDVANFIGQLSASLLFEDVNMGYAKTVEYRDRTAREFRASCYLAR